MRLSIIASGAILAATGVHAVDPPPKQSPIAVEAFGSKTPQGCYSSIGNMTVHAPIPASEMSTGSCNDVCKADKFWVAAMRSGTCWCGFVYPPEKDVVDDSKCNIPCPAYPLEACGGKENTYSVWSNGAAEQPVGRYDPSSSSTTAASKTSVASSTSPGASSPVSTGNGGTTVTQTTAPTETSKTEKSGPNVAGIAAGVVVGVVVAGAAIAGIIFFMRRKRNSQIEEEHRRNAAVNAFISGSKPPSSHGSISMTDSRLDPVLAHRRMSDGSIADNEDYSRKILRVTNA
ncbi:hypothetical protein QQS21_010701 [Conoideocrella luteorostrata]|uniref:WSC domain-containing protein n=1 Tax=Conoideocrella luteorostrata TaxID=1105319 RepID=A0AAJ0CH91_9HYPO|nr:hypothetical protein QQS21_010701 [Conoideocrella luteorostrata]